MRVVFFSVIFFLGHFAFSDESASVIAAKNARIPQAKKLFEKITGLKIPATDTRVHQMALLLVKGDELGAAKIAVDDPAFINIRSRNFALRLSNKAYSANVPFNDSAALILGTIRDDRDFREVLKTKDYYDLKGTSGFSIEQRLHLSNYFEEADNKLLDLNAGLIRMNGQKVGLSQNTGVITKILSDKTIPASEDKAKKIVELNAYSSVAHPDPAGILTTRYFGEGQLSGGSNRRPIEYVVKNFLCSSLSEIGNNQASDAYVGVDVDRFPGGNHLNYSSNCKSCHTVMDGYRMAFAKMNFGNWFDEQASGLGNSHGSLAASTTGARSFWLRDYYNGGLLVQEASKSGLNSTLGRATKALVGVDVFVPTASTIAGQPSTIADARSAKINREMVDTFARPLRYNRIYSRLSIEPEVVSVMWNVLASDSDLKTKLSLADAKKTSFPIKWQEQELFFAYVYAAADYIVDDSIQELYSNNLSFFDTIFTNKAAASYTKKYSSLCLNMLAKGTDAKLTLASVKKFAICELDKNRLSSIVALYLLKKAKAGGASEEMIAGVSSLIKTQGQRLRDFAASSAGRLYWNSYLSEMGNFLAFNVSGYDLSTGVHNKMNPVGGFEFGFTVTDDVFYNLASNSYGWRGSYANGGKGVQQFGTMIGDSKAFSQCMTKKIIHSVCNVDLEKDSSELKKWANQFESDGYSIKKVVQKVSISPICSIVKKGN